MKLVPLGDRVVLFWQANLRKNHRKQKLLQSDLAEW